MNCAAQASLYRTFMQGKSSLKHQDDAVSKLKFYKKSNGLAAILIKQLLISNKVDDAVKMAGSKD